ncbi:MAG: tetratricopeptide repeat protein [Desulfitobacteriaceae bacterium]
MSAARLSKNRENGKQKKRSRPKIKPRFYLILAIILIGILTSPLLWHLSRITRAQSDFDFDSVATEIAWVDQHAPILNRWASFRDAKLWLRLNQGPREGLKQELALYQDDRHRLWLFQLLLQEGSNMEAEGVMAEFSSETTKALAQGLMALAIKDFRYAQGLLQALTGLSEKEETIRNLALAQAHLSLHEPEQAKPELKAALKAEPQNPAARMLEFNLSLAQGEWTRALELSAELDHDLSPTPIYLVQKGLLQLRQGTLDQDIITNLGSLPQGKSYANYLEGIKRLNQGRLGEGKTSLELALALGLPGQLRADAESALKQTNDRLRAEDTLKALVSDNGI